MLIASFAAIADADAFASRFPEGLLRPQPQLLIWRDTQRWPETPAPLFGLQGDILDRRETRTLLPAAVAARLGERGDNAFDDWAPAFRVAWATGTGVSAAADHCGLGHWFVWSSCGIAAIADSATAIGRRFDLGIDTTALGGLALTGAMVDHDSAIAGVKKLAAGQIASLDAGRLTMRAMPSASQLSAPENAVAETMARLLAAQPEAEIELSGGWDSRWMLAGLPRNRRADVKALTIGSDDDGDVVIARQLAANSNMQHDVIEMSGLADLGPEAFADVVADAAARDDYAANPLDRAGINLVNARRASAPRFSGQNGEIMRGFYYPGQPLRASASAMLARRVIGWRIISNDVVDTAMFNPTWLADTRATVTARLEQRLVERAGLWGDALDRFYLEQRMHRWCGTAISATLGRRSVLLPFFDPDVLALANQTPCTLKPGSQFAARDILRLDPDLARIRLATGVVPAAVAQGGMISRLSQTRRFVGKATAKVCQQFARRDMATSRSKLSGSLAFKHHMHQRIDADTLHQMQIFAPEALEKFHRGETQMSRSTMGFMLNTNFLAGSLSRC